MGRACLHVCKQSHAGTQPTRLFTRCPAAPSGRDPFGLQSLNYLPPGLLQFADASAVCMGVRGAAVPYGPVPVLSML